MIFYLSSPRRGFLPRLDHEGWWEASVNLLGCVLFGISAVTSFATGHAGALVSTGVTNWTTTFGACFLACALTACGLGTTLKAPRLRQLRELSREMADAVEHEAQAMEHAAKHEIQVMEQAVEHDVREIRAYVEFMTEAMAEDIQTAE